MVVLLRSFSFKWLSAAWSLAWLSFLLELDFFYMGNTRHPKAWQGAMQGAPK
jgi:hypothetical protein